MEVQVASQGDRLCAAFEHSITWEDDLWRADPVDVEAIHAHARRRFSELLGAVSETSEPVAHPAVSRPVRRRQDPPDPGAAHLGAPRRQGLFRLRADDAGRGQLRRLLPAPADQLAREALRSRRRRRERAGPPHQPPGRRQGRARARQARETAGRQARRRPARQDGAQPRRRHRRRAEIRRAEPRHQHRARAALPAALRSPHRPARAPVPLRPAADRPRDGGGGRARSQHRRRPRVRDHRVARPPDVDRRPGRARLLHRPGRGPALLRERRGALPEGRARPDPGRQPRADLDRADLLPRRLLRQGARGAGAVLHRPHREVGPCAPRRGAQRRGGTAHHRQAAVAGRRRHRRSDPLFRPAVLRGVQRPLHAAHPGAGADAHARAAGRRRAEGGGEDRLHLHAGRGAGLRRPRGR